jgi:starvation-inducible DNA-binding protein
MTTAEQLTQVFKDNFVAYYRSHVAHVNITGRNFRSDHKLLGGIYERRQAEIDKLAELLRTLDEYMPCDITEVLLESKIDAGELAGDADFLLDMVKQDLEYLADQYRELIVVAELEDESQIANYAQEQVLDLQKSIWMLKSTLG